MILSRCMTSGHLFILSALHLLNKLKNPCKTIRSLLDICKVPKINQYHYGLHYHCSYCFNILTYNTLFIRGRLILCFPGSHGISPPSTQDPGHTSSLHPGSHRIPLPSIQGPGNTPSLHSESREYLLPPCRVPWNITSLHPWRS